MRKYMLIKKNYKQLIAFISVSCHLMGSAEPPKHNQAPDQSRISAHKRLQKIMATWFGCESHKKDKITKAKSSDTGKKVNGKPFYDPIA
jgi:hypothetical protein